MTPHSTRFSTLSLAIGILLVVIAGAGAAYYLLPSATGNPNSQLAAETDEDALSDFQPLSSGCQACTARKKAVKRAVENRQDLPDSSLDSQAPATRPES